jgi:hypothetical protein
MSLYEQYQLCTSVESDRFRNDHYLTQHCLYYGDILYSRHVQYGLVRYHPVFVASHSRTSTIGTLERPTTVGHTDQCITSPYNACIITTVLIAIIVGISAVLVRGNMWYGIHWFDNGNTILRSIVFYYGTIPSHD